MSIWHVQTAALTHLVLNVSIPHTYSVILPFICYRVHFTLIFPYVCILYPVLCLLSIPSFPTCLIYAVCSIYFHLLPTPRVLTFSHFHVYNLGLPPPIIPLLLISSEGSCFMPLSKNQSRTPCQMWSHILNPQFVIPCATQREPEWIWFDRKQGFGAG